MSDTAIPLTEHHAADYAELPPDELLLVEEGLDLLSDYRSIRDRTERLRLKAMINAAARSQPLADT